MLGIVHKTPTVRLTAKEQAMTELQKKANEVQSRFSLSGYYKSQVKDPTPEMLADMKSTMDPETGEVVKVKKTRRVTVKKEEGTTSKSKSGRGKKAKQDEMTLESDNESEELELTDESEDDVIRDNRAAIAARKKQEQRTTTDAKQKFLDKSSELKESAQVTEPIEETMKISTVAKKPTVKRLSVEANLDSQKKPTKTTGRKKATKLPEKENMMEEEEAPTKNVEPAISEDSDEDSYIPLAQRLKMKMQDEKRSSIVDELASTKTTVPAAKKRRATKKPVKKATKDDSDSSDSLFGF